MARAGDGGGRSGPRPSAEGPPNLGTGRPDPTAHNSPAAEADLATERARTAATGQACKAIHGPSAEAARMATGLRRIVADG